MQIFEEKTIRSSYRLIKSYGDFKQRKINMVSRFPTPRRKKWWEKLAET